VAISIAIESERKRQKPFGPRSASEIEKHFRVSSGSDTLKRALEKLMNARLLAHTILDKPKGKNVSQPKKEMSFGDLEISYLIEKTKRKRNPLGSILNTIFF